MNVLFECVLVCTIDIRFTSVSLLFQQCTRVVKMYESDEDVMQDDSMTSDTMFKPLNYERINQTQICPFLLSGLGTFSGGEQNI